MTEKEMVTIKEAAELLHVHPDTLRKWLRDGKLKNVKIERTQGGHRRLCRADVIAIAEGRQPRPERRQPVVTGGHLPWPEIIKNGPIVLTLAHEGDATSRLVAANILASEISADADACNDDPPRVLMFDGELTSSLSAARLFVGVDGPGLDELVRAMDEGRVPTENEEFRKEFLLRNMKHPNCHVLSSPSSSKLVYDLAPRDYNDLLTLLKERYDVIIIATDCNITSAHNQAWFTKSDLVNVLTGPRQASLGAANEFTRRLIQAGTAPESIHVTILEEAGYPKLRSDLTSLKLGGGHDITVSMVPALPRLFPIPPDSVPLNELNELLGGLFGHVLS